ISTVCTANHLAPWEQDIVDQCSAASRTSRSAKSACPVCVVLSILFVPVLASCWHAAERVCDPPQPLRTSNPWARHPVGELEDQPVKAVLARQSHRGLVRHVSGRRLADVGRSGSRQPRRGGRLLAR